MNKENQIAFLFFSFSSEVEVDYKSLHTHSSVSRSISEELIGRTKSFLTQSGYPVYHFDESNQRGEKFGQRLSHAFQEVFNLGYKGVIALGNDTPDIALLNIDEIASSLMAGKCAVGPTVRKGAYLIGLTREQFHGEAFAELPWQKHDLLPELLRFCGIDTPALPILRDFNSYYDIKAYLKASLSGFVRKLRRILLRTQPFFPGYSIPRHKLRVNVNRPLRAPPLV